MAHVTAPTVTITLTAQEAQTLVDVMGYIGGDPVRSRRRDCDNIRYALNAAGVRSGNPSDLELGHSIYFADREGE